ncbi:MAG: D-alanine--D-alanine ligase, partial [Verrucomicrobia bacterium]|nr:D-alanine--D-alanine ligase [Verrucomicrobiota bacterium]
MSKRFERVAVLMGGPSAERDVSLKSGKAVAAGLRDAGYRVTEVDVTTTAITLPPDCEAVFIALHGTFGEDGGVQRELEKRGMPYTGSGPDTSQCAFDKLASKRVFEQAGIPTPVYQVVDPNAACALPFPVVVKPARQGS